MIEKRDELYIRVRKPKSKKGTRVKRFWLGYETTSKKKLSEKKRKVKEGGLLVRTRIGTTKDGRKLYKLYVSGSKRFLRSLGKV